MDLDKLVDPDISVIDISANLLNENFQGFYGKKKFHEEDLAFVLQRAKDMGIEAIILNGPDSNDGQGFLELIKQHTDSKVKLYATLGVYPFGREDCLEKFTPEVYKRELRKLVLDNLARVVALSDCGLDRLPANLQRIKLKLLKKHIEVAQEFNLPLFLYEHQTDSEILGFIKANRYQFSTGVVGPFRGTLEQAQKIIELNLFICITGSSLETERGIEVVRQLPLDRILIGTGSPLGEFNHKNRSYGLLLKSLINYELAPVNTLQIRPRKKFIEGAMVKSRNEPCCAIYIVHVLAELYQMPPKQVANIIYKTTKKVFFSRFQAF